MNCLTEKEINLLERHRLRGRRLANALLHLESCSLCRLKIKPATVDEILRWVEEESLGESPPLANGSPPGTNGSRAENHRREKFKDDIETDEMEADRQKNFNQLLESLRNKS